jgi:hypothetical protein
VAAVAVAGAGRRFGLLNNCPDFLVVVVAVVVAPVSTGAGVVVEALLQIRLLIVREAPEVRGQVLLVVAEALVELAPVRLPVGRVGLVGDAVLVEQVALRHLQAQLIFNLPVVVVAVPVTISLVIHLSLGLLLEHGKVT